MGNELTVFCIKHTKVAVRLGTCIECDKEANDDFIKKHGGNEALITYSPFYGYRYKEVYTTGYLSFQLGVQYIPIEYKHDEVLLDIPNEEDDCVDFPQYIPKSKQGEALRAMNEFKLKYNEYIKAKKEACDKINGILKNHQDYCHCVNCQNKRLKK
jgi:hypothetical protein